MSICSGSVPAYPLKEIRASTFIVKSHRKEADHFQQVLFFPFSLLPMPCAKIKISDVIVLPCTLSTKDSFKDPVC